MAAGKLFNLKIFKWILRTSLNSLHFLRQYLKQCIVSCNHQCFHSILLVLVYQTLLFLVEHQDIFNLGKIIFTQILYRKIEQPGCSWTGRRCRAPECWSTTVDSLQLPPHARCHCLGSILSNSGFYSVMSMKERV